ncbi:MAG: lipoyl(octanoyl) transferase LipB [Nitrosomonas sp.]|nr:lipoyl(octanoyl) transferase LipB [Nitrosomonas sp.]
MPSIIQAATHPSIRTTSSIRIRRLGVVDYTDTWQAMIDFTQQRTRETPDEIWLLQHPSVYTQGIAGKTEHLLVSSGNIPVIRTDRGGQITYHGPGQLIAYLLLDLRRWQLGVRELVRKMENTVIDLLRIYAVHAQSRVDAPGVYVGDAKIASLGLRIRRGACYHGIALNVAMDLSPFNAINPCGFPGLRITQTSELGIAAPIDILEKKLVENFLVQLNSMQTNKEESLS